MGTKVFKDPTVSVGPGGDSIPDSAVRANGFSTSSALVSLERITGRATGIAPAATVATSSRSTGLANGTVPTISGKGSSASATGVASALTGTVAADTAEPPSKTPRSDLHCSQNNAPSSLSYWQKGHFIMAFLPSLHVPRPCLCFAPDSSSYRLNSATINIQDVATSSANRAASSTASWVFLETRPPCCNSSRSCRASIVFLAARGPI